MTGARVRGVRARTVLRLALVTAALLVAVSLALFTAVEVLPGDPASQALGLAADPERVARLQEELGLDRPFHERYAGWLGGLLTGDAGVSAVTAQPVGPIVADHAARSAVLAGGALLLVVGVALPAGVIAGSRPGTARDRLVSLSALAVLSIPEFVLATLLITVFAYGLGWFPPVSLVTGGSATLADPAKLVLPTVTLAAAAGAFVLRLVRAAVAEASAAAHVEAARIAGVPESAVITRHLLPSVRAPLAQAVALTIPYLAGGALVVETAFGYPGLAALVAEAAARRDAILLGGAGMVLAAVAMAGFLLAELAGRSAGSRPHATAEASR